MVDAELIARYRAYFEAYGPGEVAKIPYWAASEKASKAAAAAALSADPRVWNFNRDNGGHFVVIFRDPNASRAKTGTPKRISAVFQGGSIESKRTRH